MKNLKKKTQQLNYAIENLYNKKKMEKIFIPAWIDLLIQTRLFLRYGGVPQKLQKLLINLAQNLNWIFIHDNFLKEKLRLGLCYETDDLELWKYIYPNTYLTKREL